MRKRDWEDHIRIWIRMQVRKLGFDKKSATKSWKVKKQRRADKARRKTSFEAKYTYSSSSIQ